MRFAMILLAILVMAGCTTVPVDSNITALSASAERQQAAITQVESAREAARADAVTACARSTDVATCMLGVAAVFASGGGSSARAVALPAYQRPPMAGEQAAAWLGPIGQLVVGAGQVYATVETARESGKTTRYVAGINAERDIAQTQAWSGAVTGVAHEIAGMPATYSAGGDVVLGTQTTVGGDQVGGSQYRGPYAGHDQQVGSDNRQGSQGPIDNHAGDCRDSATCPPPTDSPPGG